MTENEIANAIMRHKKFHFRTHVGVCNVSWGFGLAYEADLLVMTQAGYIHEIEIKRTRADLKRDFKKWNHHNSIYIKYLWFAGPQELLPSFLEILPEDYGIIITRSNGAVRINRVATERPNATKPSPEQQFNLARLGTMRYWSRK
tara:strand:+ start:292 stop:726 length:435 start_codon:yes stop_codon:yes gene_type:complete